MKLQTVFLVFLVFFTFTLFGQVEQVSDSDKIYSFPEKEAEYPGGTNEMLNFLSQNIVYPASALSANIEGRTMIQFIVEKDGSIDTIVVKKEVIGCPECSQEAIRVIRLMPKWKPGRMNGQPARTYFNLPITFQITDPEPQKR